MLSSSFSIEKMSYGRSALIGKLHGFSAASIVCAAQFISSSVFGQQSQQPQFKSAGIEVVVNRAARHPSGQIALSLIITNSRNEDVEIHLMNEPMLISDQGGAARSNHVAGLPSCPNVSASACSCCMTPAVIDKNNSITVTLAFPGTPGGTACSLDFSMPVSINGNSRNPRQITLGLPNVRVC